eukprot:NODE_351_length_8976_cov_1.105666.p7 type:complete len:110 gc:universal NODE_351_length_8976_cov_1.105666:7320-6991(-)
MRLSLTNKQLSQNLLILNRSIDLLRFMRKENCARSIILEPYFGMQRLLEWIMVQVPTDWLTSIKTELDATRTRKKHTDFTAKQLRLHVALFHKLENWPTRLSRKALIEF